MTAPSPASPEPHEALRRRTVALLAAAQALGGLAAGSLVSVGSLIAVDLAGSTAWAGSVTTAATLGTAASAVALARLAVSRGRRRSLTTGLGLATAGALAVVAATATGALVLLLLGALLLGVSGAVTLQARFAATDLSTPRTRARDLSLVVWTGTIGAVTGPNLVRLAEPLGRLTGLPDLGALFLLPAAGTLAAGAVLAVGLRPDPLLTARGGAAGGPPPRHVTLREVVAVLRRFPAAAAAVLGLVVAHATMVAVMSMTPVHMAGHGASVQLVGLTVSLHLAAMFGLSPVMGILTDRLGAVAVLVAGLVVVLAACLTSGAAGGTHAWVTVGLVLLGLGWSAATVAGSAVLAGTVPGDARVATQGAADALMSLAGAGGGALAGVALAQVGYGGLGTLTAAVAAAGAVGVLVLRRASPRVAAPAA